MAQPVAAPRPPRPIGRVHWLGVWTLFRREFGRFIKEWLESVVAPVFLTVVYLTVFTFALGPQRNTPEGAAVLAFILPGLVVFTVLQRAAETTVFTIMFDKLEGIISDVLMPPLAPSEITAAYALAGAAAGLVTGLPVLTAAMLLFGMTALQPLVMLAFAVGGALMLSLTGMLVGIWAARWDHVGAFLGFVLIPLAFLSGMFAPISDLPAPLPTLMLANPIHYVIDGFRAGAIGVHRAPVWLSLTVVAATDIVLWLLCRHLLQRGWKLRA